jgi:hypothetical protein
MNLRKMKNSALKSLWFSFKKKRRLNEDFSKEDNGYLTMMQREEMLEVLFSRLKVKV